MRIYDYIDEKWLRANRDQLWAEVVELEERGRLDYYKETGKNNITMRQDEEKFPDTSSPKNEEAEQLQQKHMKLGIKPISHGIMLLDLIKQQFVVKEPKLTWVKMDDVRKVYILARING